MIQFNEKLKNYKSKNFGIITLDENRTKRKDDAYSIDMYDENHFFVGVYITNPYEKSHKEKVINHVLKDQQDYFRIDFINKYLGFNSFSCVGGEQSSFVFKFLIDLEGNICDFAINKETIKIDYELNEEDVEYLFESNIEDLKEEEISVLHMLETMHIIGDIVYMKRTNSMDAENRDINYSFTNSFHSQFLLLTNIYTARLFSQENFAYLYHNCKLLNTKLPIIDSYYSPDFEENINYGELMGANTSPLRNEADAINIAIINDVLFDQYGLEKYISEEWKDRIKDVKIIKSNRDDYYHIMENTNKK